MIRCAGTSPSDGRCGRPRSEAEHTGYLRGTPPTRWTSICRLAGRAQRLRPRTRLSLTERRAASANVESTFRTSRMAGARLTLAPRGQDCTCCARTKSVSARSFRLDYIAGRTRWLGQAFPRWGGPPRRTDGRRRRVRPSASSRHAWTHSALCPNAFQLAPSSTVIRVHRLRAVEHDVPHGTIQPAQHHAAHISLPPPTSSTARSYNSTDPRRGTARHRDLPWLPGPLHRDIGSRAAKASGGMAWVIAVRMSPGCTALTRTPRCASSLAAAW